MVGTTVSHYKILEHLGGGGMGVVYKAIDLKLDRPVALKFLPPELTRNPQAKERFIHEAKAASALPHNNICVVHDIDETSDGQIFICMGYLEGETIKKKLQRAPMAVEEAVEIAIQVAQGLAKAHACGVVHRDIKPANIMVTTEGVAKIVDFGLAKLRDVSSLTKDGAVLGTAAYMSPEQVLAGAVDQRSDLWSLGVVLYEMLAGRLPFRGEHEVAVSYSIVNEEPIPLEERRAGIPQGVRDVIWRCLEKDPQKRYQHADEVITDLRRLQQLIPVGRVATRGRRWWRYAAGGILFAVLAVLAYIDLRSPAPPRTEKSVAVLPFVDMSPNKDQEYFCDGIMEELINRLSNIRALKVPARTSVLALRGTSLNIREIGNKLNVETVLEGSVRKDGDRIRISAQLIDVRDALHLWAQMYNREQKDIFAIQSDVAQQIAAALDATLSPGEQEQLKRQSTANLDAYNAYLQGRFYWRKRTAGDLARAAASFRNAIRLDSGYSSAYVGLADCYAIYPFYHVPELSQEEAFRLAEQSARKALALDPSLADAHTALANILKEGYWNWKGAEQEFQRAIELDPRYATARQWYSENLMVQGKRAEALAEARRAAELEPSSAIISNNLGLQYLMDRQYDNAIVQLRKSIELDPSHPSLHLNLASAYFLAGAYGQAAGELPLTGTPSALAELALEAIHDTTRRGAVAGQLDAYAAGNPGMPPSVWVRMYAMLNQRDRTLAWLARSCATHDPEIIYIIRHPLLDRFLPDPRYTAILRKMGLS